MQWEENMTKYKHTLQLNQARKEYKLPAWWLAPVVKTVERLKTATSLRPDGATENLSQNK